MAAAIALVVGAWAAPPLSGTPLAAAAASTGGWPTYHHDNTRAGVDASTTFTSRLASGDWSVDTLDADVFASPVVFNGMVYVATENDSVYALSEASGATAWHTQVAFPIPGTSTYIGCSASQFGAHNGITGTPAVDPSTGEVYVVGTVDLGSGNAVYRLFALNGSTGAEVWHADLSGPVVRYQNQRGALAVANGRVYVPFGGRDGDCGTYHPYVLSAATTGGAVTTYQPQTAGQNEAGIWAPSGESVDAAGNVYVETGNGAYSTGTPCDTTQWDHGDAVIKLSPTLTELGFFAPSNWCALNAADADLGSIAPLALPSNEMLASGKSGEAWLFSTAAMPGFGAPQQQGHLSGCATSDAVFGGFAFSAPYAYVPCDGDGVVALSVNTSAGSYSQAWTATAPGGGTYSPGAPIVAGGVLWDEPQGGGAVYGYNPSTGALTYDIGLSAGAHRFTTLAADGNRLFAMLDHGVQSLAFNTPTSFPVAYTAYLPWFDRLSSSLFTSDNVHVVNPGTSSVYVNVAIPGSPGCTVTGDTISAGAEAIYTCATGFGGPVVVQASAPVVVSQRVKYGATFNEVPAQSAASTSLVFPWYDLASDPGFTNDNIHVVNPNAGSVSATVTIPGCGARVYAIAAGGEAIVNCPGGFGGPVTVTSTGGAVIASQRVQYYGSFNEEPALVPANAATSLFSAWYDLRSDPGFRDDNIHVVDPGATDASVSVSVPGCATQSATVPHGSYRVFSCPGGFGGPVHVQSNNGVGVLASLRVRYDQSFNEVAAQPAAGAAATLWSSWYDLASDPNFLGDDIHVVNPNGSGVSAVVMVPGCGSRSLTVGSEQDAYVSCPGSIGGPVKVVSSGGPVLVAQRVRYAQSFNEVAAQP